MLMARPRFSGRWALPTLAPAPGCLPFLCFEGGRVGPPDSPDTKDRRESDSEEASMVAAAAAWCSHVTMELAPSWMACHSTLSRSEAGSEPATSSLHP